MILVYVTHPDEKTAKFISQACIENHLAACANILPITSCFWWKSTYTSQNEFVTIFKTIPSKWKQLKEIIEKNHPYSVPCIMKISVEANDSFEKWVRESVT